MHLKTRDAGCCNIKLFLLFLVVYGHVIEGRIAESELLMMQYRLIYSFHMPAFVFLSGRFLGSREACKRQVLRAAKLYVLLQTGLVLADAFFLQGNLKFAIPVWHLWYLLSMACWGMAAYLWNLSAERFPVLDRRGAKLGVILAAALTALMAGCCPSVGRGFSMSRTLVFLPYFLAGLFTPESFSMRRRQGGMMKIAGLAAGAAGIVLFLCFGGELSADFLYQADGYGGLGCLRGIRLRSFSYLLGGLFTFFLLQCMPGRKLACSRAGADTMKLYLCHAPLAWLAGRLPIGLPAFTAAAPFLAGAVMLLLYEAFRFGSPLYIVSENYVRTEGEGVGSISGCL